MEITKVAGLTEEEKETLVKAGEILGAFNKAKSSNEFDLVVTETRQLFEALKKVIDEVVSK